MSIRWCDVTIPLRKNMTVWPGDPPFEFDPLRRIENSDECNTSRVSFSTHTGTHIDAPWHFEVDGGSLDTINPNFYFGQALLIDMTNVPTITADAIGTGPFPPRVLFKTRNSNLALDAAFVQNYVALESEAAQRLVENDVRLVGVDYLSVGPFGQEGHMTHHALLRNNVVVVEGLRLNGFAAGMYHFVVLPIRVAGADGAPCRAFLGIEEATA